MKSKRQVYKITAFLVFIFLVFGGVYYIHEVDIEYVPAFAIILSAVLALIAAFYNVAYQRQTARENNSLEFQKNLLQDKKYAKCLEVAVRVMSERKIPVRELAKREVKQEHQTEARAVRYVLNTWERAANAILHNLYDEQFLYEAHKSMVIHFGVYFREFIDESQKYQVTFYQNLNWLILHWSIRRDSFAEKETKKALKKVFNELSSIKSGKIPRHLR